MNLRKFTVLSIVSVCWGCCVPAASAGDLQSYTSMFTVANIERYLPGYSAAQYANMAKIIQTDFASDANCVATFNFVQTNNLTFSSTGTIPAADKAVADSCGTYIDGRVTAYGLGGISWNPLQQLYALYGAQQYAATASPQIMTITTTRYVDNITSVLGSITNVRQRGGPSRFPLENVGKGLAGGDVPSRTNGWMSGGLNETRNLFGLSSYVGVVGNVMGGVDYAVNNQTTAGLSGGFDYSVIKTVFSNSVMKGAGITLAPYISHQFADPRYSVDALVGYSFGTTDIEIKGGGVTTTGKPKYDRQFLATNLNLTNWYSDLQVTGRLGYLYATENISGVQSLATIGIRNTIQQAKFSGQVGYWMDSWMPYAAISYVYDVKRSYETLIPDRMRDKDAFTASLGADIFSKGGWNGGVVLAAELDRKYVRNNSLTANLSRSF